MRRIAAAATLLGLLLLGCSDDATTTTVEGGTEASGSMTAETAPTSGTEISGTFEAIFHFEAQCTYLDAGGERSLSLSVPDGYTVEPDGPWDPASSETAQGVLLGPDGEIVAKHEDPITVTGTVEELPPGPCFTTEIIRAETVTKG